MFWLWGHAQVVLGFFFSNFFNSPRIATIVGYILVVAGVMVSLLLELLQVRIRMHTCTIVHVYATCTCTFNYIVHVLHNNSDVYIHSHSVHVHSLFYIHI